MDSKKLRILFVDDDCPSLIDTFKGQGYDVDHWTDINNLEQMVDGRYHVVFMDIRGVGGKLGGNGLHAIKYIAEHNPLIFRVVFSAKPLSSSDGDLVRRYANKALKKDVTFYEVLEEIERYSEAINKKWIMDSHGQYVRLSAWQRFWLARGKMPSEAALRRAVSTTGNAAESLRIATNVTAIALSLIKIYVGGS